MKKPHISSNAFRFLLLVCVIGIPLFLHRSTIGTSNHANASQRPPRLSSQPASVSFFGMNTYFTGLERFWNDDAQGREQGTHQLIELGREAGVQWGREEISWANLQYARGKWERDTRALYDEDILAMAEAGYGIIGMLLTTPEWARVSDCQERLDAYDEYNLPMQAYWCPPANVQDYADFVTGIVERYDGDGFQDAPGSPRIAVWQIWNEPNHWETWPGTPAEYAALLKAGYTAVKAADPTAIVATAGLYVLDGQSMVDDQGCSCHKDGLYFFDQVLATDPTVWDFFDVLAIHPYMPFDAPDSPDILPKVTMWGRIHTANEWLLAQTQRRGGSVRPLWITEVGWTTCGNAQLALHAPQNPNALARYRIPDTYRTGSTAHLASETLCKTEQEQADYTIRAHGIAQALGVQHLNYHQLEDKFDAVERDIWQGTAILRTKAENYAPKPAYTAYKRMTQELEGASFIGLGTLHNYLYRPDEQENPVGRYHMRYQTPQNVQIDMLWRSSGAQEVTFVVEPAARYVELVTASGTTIALSPHSTTVNFVVSEEPVYLRQERPPPTPTPTATATPTAVPSPTETPTLTAVPTATDTPTVTPTPSPTATPTPTMPPTDTYEPDDTCTQASDITANGRIQQRTFHEPGEMDWVQFEAISTTTYLVEAWSPPYSLADVALEVSNRCGATPMAKQDTFAPDVRMTYRPISDSLTLLHLFNHTTTRTGVYDLSVRTLPVSNTDALIIVAGRLEPDNPQQPNLDRVASRLNTIAREHGYTSNRIVYLSGKDAPFTSTNQLETAITEWASNAIGTNGMLTLYIAGHGGPDYIYLDRETKQKIISTDIHTWLNQLEKKRPDIAVNVILEASFSGSFLLSPGTLSKEGRVIITSTGAQNLSLASDTGIVFSDYFLDSLGQGSSLLRAFQKAQWAVRGVQGISPSQQTTLLVSEQVQTPWLDDDGNGITRDSQQGEAAQQRGLNTAASSSTESTTMFAPYIVGAEVADNQIQATVRRGTKNTPVTVKAAVYPPDHTFSQSEDTSEESSEEAFIYDASIPTVQLAEQQGNQSNNGYEAHYRVTYPNFTIPGTYRVVLYAEDETANLEAIPMSVEIQVDHPTPTPTATHTPQPTPTSTPTPEPTPEQSVFLPLVRG